MKKMICLLTVATMLMTGCSAKTNSDAAGQTGNETTNNTVTKDGTYEGTGSGYNGDITVKVTTKDGEITDIEMISNNESPVIVNRAFPLLKDRIMEAQTPVVDTVTGATFTSYAVKSAVAQAMAEAGKEVETITFATSGPEVEAVEAEAVNTQLVIVGGGPAGLAAAIEAKENGVSDVIVIEKLDILSGNAKFDLNFYDIFNSEAQKAAGVEDSIEAFVSDKQGVFDSEERLLAQAEGASVVDAWLRSFGAELNHYYGTRDHMAESNKYAGERIQEKMEERVAELGIEVRTGTKGVDLIMEDGKAVGVKVESKTEHYDILADAVIVATGGFSSNKELLAQYAPGTEVLPTTNQYGTTGDFISIFEANNIALDNMDKIRVFKATVSGKRDVTNTSVDGFIFVNTDGERFVDEKKGEMEMANAILSQADGKAYYIYDQAVLDKAYNLQKQEAAGYAVKADTLEELGELLGINGENLAKTVETFNQAVAGEIDDPFRATACEKAFEAQGPYYGFRVESAVHQTKGGVVANENAQVLTNDGEAVEGLYAAGEVTSSSAAYSAAVIFGRISGEQAAEFILNK